MRVAISAAILLAFTLLTGCSNLKQEIIIVPKNYIGYIVIIHNEKDGIKPRQYNKKIIFEIPATGVLKTQQPVNHEWSRLPEFYYEEIAQANRIPFCFDFKKIPVDSVVAYGGSSGNANKDQKGNETVAFTLYFVGNKAQISDAYDKAEKLDISSLSE